MGVQGRRYQLTQHKTGKLLDQLMGLRFSVGAISQAPGKVAAALKVPVAQTVDSLGQAKALWMDETHHPRKGAGNWVWAAVQPLLAVFAIDPSRARYLLHDLIGTQPSAVVTTDRYASYAFLDPEQRQICWAHLLRDFNRIGQRAGLAGPIGLIGPIGRRLHALGYGMFRLRDKGQLTGRTSAGPIAARSFTTNTALVPTNNAADQALRSSVLKRKLSGPTRSLRGDQFLSRGFTVHETCLHQGVDRWNYLHKAVVAWIEKTVPPSLLPPPRAVPTG